MVGHPFTIAFIVVECFLIGLIPPFFFMFLENFISISSSTNSTDIRELKNLLTFLQQHAKNICIKPKNLMKVSSGVNQ